MKFGIRVTFYKVGFTENDFGNLYEKVRQILNGIKLCIWGRNRAGYLTFGMGIFNVVWVIRNKGFLEISVPKVLNSTEFGTI